MANVGLNARLGAYLFPDTALNERPSASLLTMIEQMLPDANDHTDGTDMHSDVRIDYAQDMIEQARDILLARGHAFSEQDREAMDFLSWPLSEAAQVEAERREAIERDVHAKRVRKFNISTAAMRRAVEAGVRGYDQSNESLRGFMLTISAQITRVPGHAVSGRAVLKMVDEAEKILGARPRHYYACSAPGITFENDPNPAWWIELPLTNQPQLWALIKSWMALPTRPGAEAWDMREEYADSWYCRPHESMSDLFERRPLGAPWDFMPGSNQEAVYG